MKCVQVHGHLNMIDKFLSNLNEINELIFLVLIPLNNLLPNMVGAVSCR